MEAAAARTGSRANVTTLVLQLSKQAHVARLLRQHQHRNYTHVIYLRPDLVLVRPFPSLHRLAYTHGADDRPIIYIPGASCSPGNEDWLALGLAAPMTAYLERGTLLSEWFAPDHRGWIAEHVVKALTKHLGGQLVAHPGIDACVLRCWRWSGEGQLG